MSEMLSRYGIVGFFDILGYSSILENNGAEGATKEVLAILTNLEDRIGQQFHDAFQKPEVVQKVLTQFNWLVFSDTILLTTTLDKDSSVDARYNRWKWFFFASLVLNRSMFDSGLPLRGAVATGEFVVEKNCFAGKAIVEAYTLGHDLDLAASVLTNGAETEFFSLANKVNDPGVGAFSEAMLPRYLIPRKGGIEDRLRAFNIVAIRGGGFEQLESRDIRQYVCKSFWRHNKDLRQSEHSKVLNTEMFLRFCAPPAPPTTISPK